jgi:SAM-dependent methyltransferase
MERDQDNVTFIHTVESLYSERGLRFQREKYRPKIDFLKHRFGKSFTAIRLLDIGVGYGVFLNILEHEEGCTNLFGMDPFPDSIEIAGAYTSAVIVRGDITDEEWPVEESAFDAITCFDVVEHLERPELFFIRVKRYLRGGGVVVVTTPNRGLPYLMRKIPLVGFPDRNPTHINVRPPRYWRELAAAHGFRIVRTWRGEHLTHIRLIPKILTGLCRLFGIDHRRVPVVSAFEQSFCMVIEPE